VFAGAEGAAVPRGSTAEGLSDAGAGCDGERDGPTGWSAGSPIHQAAAAAESGGWLGKGKLAADRLAAAEGGPDRVVLATPGPMASWQKGHRSGRGVPGRNGCWQLGQL
jgi:hypothetical protein